MRAVAFLGQGGNISLWQQLPEKTPRDIPDAYKKMRIQDHFSKQGLVKLSKTGIEFYERGFGGIFIVGWISLFISIFLMIFAANHNYTVLILGVTNVGAFWLVSVGVFVFVFKSKYTSTKRN